MNIMILSVGTRDKIVMYFKRELGNEGKVIAVDSSPLASALYKADKHYLVPRITQPNYLEVIKDICISEKVTALFSLIDPELSLLAKNKEKFEAIGIQVIVADYEVVQTCFNKLKFAQFLKTSHFNTPRTYGSLAAFDQDYILGKIQFPVFAKPCNGSASLNINKVEDMEELILLTKKYENLIIQEYMDGQEIGVDVYIDLITGEVTSIFAKEKIRMRAGETDKSLSMKDENLFELIIQLVKVLKLKGQNDIDIFRQDGIYYISEVNPRFGGGYPHAYECGVNFPKSLIHNLKGISNKRDIGNYEVDTYMIKYNEVCMIKKNDKVRGV